MSETKHTPGDWKVETIQETGMLGDYEYGVYAATGELIARTGKDLNEYDRFCNAHLIAAAPCMLEALKAIKSAPYGDDPDAWLKVDQAISKATGHTQP